MRMKSQQPRATKAQPRRSKNQKNYKQNITLGNSFIPTVTPSIITRALSRLPLDSLTKLCVLWSQLPQTQPKPTKLQQRDLYITSSWLIADFKEYLEKFKNSKSKTKRKLIDKLLVDYYNNGLNLLQFAQLDSQLMVEKPLNFLWQSSKLINSNSEDEVINLHNPQSFLDHLLRELSKYFMNHIYISNHPHYPLMILRIQLFDLITESHIPSLKHFTTSNSIISRKPIFIALPINSCNILHTYQSNLATDQTIQIVLQCFQIALSNTLDKQLRVLVNENEPPIKSLESLHILKGNSRFAESLGPWAPYADGSVDISPFDDVKNHPAFKPEKIQMIDVDERRKRIAMLRFKGSLHGLQSEKLYEDVKNRKRKVRKNNSESCEIMNFSNDTNVDESGETAEIESDDDLEEKNISSNKYTSITPVQTVKLEIRNEYNGFRPSVKLVFMGKDVFGGLHELCDMGLMNPETVPGWLTGQESQCYNGIIEDDIFKKRAVVSGSSGTLI